MKEIDVWRFLVEINGGGDQGRARLIALAQEDHQAGRFLDARAGGLPSQASPDRVSAEPVAVDPADLAECTCLSCLSRVWAYRERATILDREWWRDVELLSLHPCMHEWTAEDIDDPDWGWVERVEIPPGDLVV
jgi:hypothetical protein